MQIPNQSTGVNRFNTTQLFRSRVFPSPARLITFDPARSSSPFIPCDPSSRRFNPFQNFTAFVPDQEIDCVFYPDSFLAQKSCKGAKECDKMVNGENCYSPKCRDEPYPDLVSCTCTSFGCA